MRGAQRARGVNRFCALERCRTNANHARLNAITSPPGSIRARSRTPAPYHSRSHFAHHPQEKKKKNAHASRAARRFAQTTDRFVRLPVVTNNKKFFERVSKVRRQQIGAVDAHARRGVGALGNRHLAACHVASQLDCAETRMHEHKQQKQKANLCKNNHPTLEIRGCSFVFLAEPRSSGAEGFSIAFLNFKGFF